ncbi:carbohydrate kinase family protein [Kribbella endophytica]
MAPDPTNLETASIIDVLSKLRGHGGLTSSPSNCSTKLELLSKALLKLPFIEQVPPTELLFELIITIVRGDPKAPLTTSLIVADTIFALGLLDEIVGAEDNANGTVRQLYTGKLGARRRWLVTHWEDLHIAAGTPEMIPRPTDGHLRKTLEEQVLGELADQLIVAVRQESSSPRRPSIAVVGGATTDLTLSVESVPTLETSAEAIKQRYTPGGKGLLQAVAAARLGARSTLIAAVADDKFGQRINDLLTEEGVDATQLKKVPGAVSSITYVIEGQQGASIAVNVRGGAVLNEGDIDGVADLLSTQDGLLVTFEIPPATLTRLLDLPHLRRADRPVVVLTPGQPYLSTVRLDRQLLRNVDCLVARPWELARLFQEEKDLSDSQLVKYFLRAGVAVVCLMTGQGCEVHIAADRVGFQSKISFQIPPNSSVARDAFCAALAVARCSNPIGWREAVQAATVAMGLTAQKFADQVVANLTTVDEQSLDSHDNDPNLSIRSLPDLGLVESNLSEVDIAPLTSVERPITPPG